MSKVTMKNNQASRFTVRPRHGEPDYEHHSRSIEYSVSLPIDNTIRLSRAWGIQRMREMGYGLGFDRPTVATVERRRLDINWDAAPDNRVTTSTVRVSAAILVPPTAQVSARRREILKTSLDELAKEGVPVDFNRVMASASEWADNEAKATPFPYVSQRGPLVIPAETLLEVVHEMRDKFGTSPEFAQAIFIPTTRLLDAIHQEVSGSAGIAIRVVEELLGLRQYYLANHTPEYLEDFLSESWMSVLKGELPGWRRNSEYWRKGVLKRLRSLLLSNFSNFDPQVGLKKMVQLVDETVRIRPEIQLLEHVGRRRKWESAATSPADDRRKAERLIYDLAGGEVILERWLLCLAGLDGQKARMSHSETAREIDRDPELREEFATRFGSLPDPHNAKRFFETHFAEKIKLDLLNRVTGQPRVEVRAEATHFIQDLAADAPRSGSEPATSELSEFVAALNGCEKVDELQTHYGPFGSEEDLAGYVRRQSPSWIVRFATSRPRWFAQNIPEIDSATGSVVSRN